MASLPDASVDVVITDPPYEAEAHTAQRMVARAGGRLECEPITFPPITEEQRTESARQMARLARRWILVFCQVEGAMKWRAALEAGGAVYKRTCQWIKPDGKPQYSPPIPPLAPAKFTGSLFVAEGSQVRPECTNFASSLQKSTGSYVQAVAPNGAGTTAGMLGYMFWAAERPSTRGVTTTPPNTCEGGVGAGATAYQIPVPMPALRAS